MQRRPDELGNGDFDVLVIGGGIYGAWTAYDAALRGEARRLNRARVERDASMDANMAKLEGMLIDAAARG
jgi:glycine/D-amino acid oxidase-like deaminating enzyme